MKVANTKTGMRVAFTPEEFNRLNYDKVSMQYVGAPDCWIKLVPTDGKDGTKIGPNSFDRTHPYNASFYHGRVPPELRNLKMFGTERVNPKFIDDCFHVPEPHMDVPLKERVYKHLKHLESAPPKSDEELEEEAFEVATVAKTDRDISLEAVRDAVLTINAAKSYYKDDMRISMLPSNKGIKIKMFVEI